MRKIHNYLILLTSMTVVSPCYSAFYINGDVSANDVVWKDVTYGKGDTMVPSKWGVPPALDAVKSWSAGSLPAEAASSIILKGGLNNETTTAIPLSISGVQYNTAGIDFVEGSNSSGGGCDLDEVLLPIVSVKGIGCISSSQLSVSTPTSPFVLYRPMFAIEEAKIIEALKGKAEGIYSASVPISIRYYYENVYGVSTYRNFSDVVIFSFKYEPVEITDLVILEGNGELEPVYDKDNKRISATTSYKLEAQGYFNNGIILTLPTKEYELVHTSSPELTIPYNISCNECNTVQLVSDGVLLEQTTSIGEGSGIQTNLPFTLLFDYDVEGDYLSSGQYTDAITIVVEPAI
ncbi:hypothetical protein ACGDLY_001285 [Vibrio campbellii]